jgi:hypothetical protein
MIQVATTLPMFLFSIPAGALADIADKRRLLVIAEVAATVVSAITCRRLVELGNRRKLAAVCPSVKTA